MLAIKFFKKLKKMADKKKSILEEAILDAKRIQEALNANTKEILRSVAKEEIESLVKESIEEDYMEEDVDEDETEVADASDDAGEEIELDDIEGDDEAGEEEEIEAGEEEDEIEVGDIDNSDVGGDLEGDYETGMDAVASDDEIEMDMTTASDDDVIAVYKKLTGDDEIEVVVDDEAGEVKLNVSEPGEFVIKMDDEGSVEDIEIDSEIEDEVMDEVMYEIDLDEDEYCEEGEEKLTEEEDCDDEEKLTEEEDSDDEEKLTEEEISEKETCEEGEEPIEEKIQVGKGRTVANTLTDIKGAGGKANNVKAPNVTAPVSETTKKYNALLTEAKELKGKNGEYKQALKQFRTMLAETVVFNSNLTYVTKLFMEHSTTKTEKEGIFKRFDNEVSTLKESKKLYKAIASELGSRKPMNESINNKIEKEVNSGTSKQLNESTVYVDTETSRIMDLIKRVDKK